MATSSSVSQLYRSFLAVARRWPADPLRPEHNFGASLRAATHRAFLRDPPEVSRLPPPGTVPPKGAKPLQEALQSVDDEALAKSESSFKTLNKDELEYARKSLRALEGMLKGQSVKDHPAPPQIMRPASNPQYYERLLGAIDRAARGDSVKPTFRERLAIFFGRKG